MVTREITDTGERPISLFEKIFIGKRAKEFANEAARFEERHRVRSARPRLINAITEAEQVLEIMTQNLYYKDTDIARTIFNSYLTTGKPVKQIVNEIIGVPILKDAAPRLVELAKIHLSEAKKELASFDIENAAVLSEIAAKDAESAAQNAREQATGSN